MAYDQMLWQVIISEKQETYEWTLLISHREKWFNLRISLLFIYESLVARILSLKKASQYILGDVRESKSTLTKRNDKMATILQTFYLYHFEPKFVYFH